MLTKATREMYAVPSEDRLWYPKLVRGFRVGIFKEGILKLGPEE